MAYANNSVHYYSDYGIQPDSIVNSSEVDNIPSILTSEYLPTLEEEGMLFEGWYTTPTFDEGTLAEPGVFAWDKSASLYLYAKWSANTVASLLTNLADELRTLTNTTDKMGLSVMAGHVSDANTEVDEQSAVVDELLAALQGKSVPGGDAGGEAVETCTVTVTRTASDIFVGAGVVYYVGLNESGVAVATTLNIPFTDALPYTFTFECVKNTIVYLSFAGDVTSVSGGVAEENKYYPSLSDGDNSIWSGSRVFVTANTVEIQTRC